MYWEFDHNGHYMEEELKYADTPPADVYRCSNCNYPHYTAPGHKPVYPYCPNCREEFIPLAPLPGGEA